VAEVDAAPVTRAFLAALLRDMSARVNVVNSSLIAEERGIAVTTSYRQVAGGKEPTPALQTVVRTSAGEHSVAGALFGGQRDGRITEIDGFRIEVIPAGYMLVTRSNDVPGVIGRVGMELGERGINISHFHLGRRERGGEAISVIETDAPLDDETLERLRSIEQIISTRQIELEA
jgi:D-3-phosphoglycerate dehydrogenase